MSIYKIAKKIVERKERKAKEMLEKSSKEENIQYEKYLLQEKLISSMATKLISELVEDFTSKNKPKFEEGQKVLLHPYYRADGWEPDGWSLFHHTPFEGPVEVVIDSVSIDTSRAYEIIMDHFRDRDDFSRIYSNSQWNDFKTKANRIWATRLYEYERVMYCYSFHISDSERQYWRYSLREDKFLLPNSKAGRAAKQIAALKKKRKNLEKKAKEAQIKYNELYNLIY